MPFRIYRWQLPAILSALLMVEVAAFAKCVSFLSWGYPSWQAYMVSAAFVGLMVSSIVALSLDLDAAMRSYIFRAGILLIAFQSLANVTIVYQELETARAVASFSRLFFELDQEWARKLLAVIQGATLSGVSYCFWKVTARMLREESKVPRQRLQLLKGLGKQLRKPQDSTGDDDVSKAI